MIKVNGRQVPEQAVQFELERLMRFYAEHGVPEDKIRQELPMLKERATQQAIGARLLFDEAARLELPVSEEEVLRPSQNASSVPVLVRTSAGMRKVW